MATLQLLDSPTDPHIGGILFQFPSGASKALHWRSQHPTPASHAVAKELAGKALQDRLDSRAIDDAERTNWVSVVAACGRLVRQWNERVGAFGLVDPRGGGGEGPLSGPGVTPS